MNLERHDGARAQGYLTIKTFHDGKLIREVGPFANKVVSSDGYGRNLILRQMVGDDTYPIVFDAVAIGDDDTAAADGDTDLGNPLVTGIPITNMSLANNVLSMDVFVSDADLPDDTYEEFGIYAAGRLMARIIISPAYTKATGEDTIFTYELTLTG
jgi:hypothetical protein